jgi:uncharacterized protein YcbK (DUF882 family)
VSSLNVDSQSAPTLCSAGDCYHPDAEEIYLMRNLQQMKKGNVVYYVKINIAVSVRSPTNVKIKIK